MKTFLPIDLKNMTSNLSDDIEHETATEDVKREGTCTIIFLYLASTASIRGYSLMIALKKIRKFDFLLTPFKLLSHLSLKQASLTSH